MHYFFALKVWVNSVYIKLLHIFNTILFNIVTKFGSHLGFLFKKTLFVQSHAGDVKAEEIPSREKRNNYPSPFWWLPGHTQVNRPTYSQIHCGDPGRPQFGTSLFESVQPGALVVHSCNPGYYLAGAKLRLCQSNGQWTPQLPQCVCKYIYIVYNHHDNV